MPHGDITHIDIPVADLGAATEFYEALFGWTITAPPGFAGYPMWQAPNEVSGGGLAPRSEGFTQPRSYVEVDSIDDTLAQIQERGGTIVRGKEEITATSWWAVFRDPDGNIMGLYEGVTDV
ncbi:VOC family protein [Demequina globuliformis]|uniref:VOC family protein n=1 Tax=Demequina globuliformis TaxID=676202 RepID=UPI00078278F3|nr:VOC family protein [Demequina globuliformis]